MSQNIHSYIKEKMFPLVRDYNLKLLDIFLILLFIKNTPTFSNQSETLKVYSSIKPIIRVLRLRRKLWKALLHLYKSKMSFNNRSGEKNWWNKKGDLFIDCLVWFS